MQQLTESQRKAITVLARAVSDDAFLASLRKDPQTALRNEGVTEGERLYVPDDDCLDTLACVLKCLGDVFEKRQ